MARPEGRSRLVLWTIAAVAYVLLSLAAFLASSIPSLGAIVDRAWSLVWLFGPPVTLIHRLKLLTLYLVETVLFFGLLLAATRGKSLWGSAILGVLALAVWLLSGHLAIGILT
jgi:hypothetical protein